MEISYKVSSYFSSTIKSDVAEAGKAYNTSKENNESIIQNGDSVNISQQGRALQKILSGQESQDAGADNGQGKSKSRLMSHLNGEEPDNSKGIAYGGAKDSAAAQGSGDDDTAQRIQVLQAQLKAAMSRLQQARRELGAAQGKSAEGAKDADNGKDPAAALGPEQQQAAQEQKSAQQKVVSAQAEVNTIQEQLQKYLQEQAKNAGK